MCSHSSSQCNACIDSSQIIRRVVPLTFCSRDRKKFCAFPKIFASNVDTFLSEEMSLLRVFKYSAVYYSFVFYPRHSAVAFALKRRNETSPSRLSRLFGSSQVFRPRKILEKDFYEREPLERIDRVPGAPEV